MHRRLGGPGVALGRGAAAAQGVEPDFLVGTLGKALGVAGAFVIGPPELRELLVSFGRSFVYTTALPDGVAEAARVGLRLADAERRERLAANAARLRAGLAQIGARTLGAAHKQTFEVECEIPDLGQTERGIGASRRAAEQAAAAAILMALKAQGHA